VVAATPFRKEGIDAMTDDERKTAEAIARAFETFSRRLSRELEGAFNQMAQLIGQAQQQQYEIIGFVGKQSEAIKALADIVANKRDNDVESHNGHAGAIEQLLQGQMKIARFTDDLATQYRQLFKALSNRLDAVEKEAFGPNYYQQPSTPPLN
jgi:BMFP domain-containing protein YqiC